MPNPSSEILDVRAGISPLVPARIALWPERARPARRVRSAIRAQVTRFLAWRARQVTLRLLSKLDAATLRDLGITDVESAVHGDPQGRMRGYDPNWWSKL
jgi:uncharacterized protein YjiS (DUF1127 family)